MIASKKTKLKFPPHVAAAATIEKRGPLMLDVSCIDAGDNPRQTFDELQGLGESMTRLSLLSPITVTPGEPGRWRLIAGERRLRAAKGEGWPKIPAYEVIGPPEVLAEMTVAENLLRIDLNLIEQARGIAALHRPKDQGGAGLNVLQIAERFKKDDSWVRKFLGFLRLPPAWQRMLATGELKFRHGVALTAYADRGDVLAAVLEDLRRNPADWESAAAFDRQLAGIVARIDGLQAPPAETLPRESAPVMAIPERRSSPVSHLVDDPPDSDCPVAQIVALLEQLTTAGQVERVERAVKARAVALGLNPRRFS